MFYCNCISAEKNISSVYEYKHDNERHKFDWILGIRTNESLKDGVLDFSADFSLSCLSQ